MNRANNLCLTVAVASAVAGCSSGGAGGNSLPLMAISSAVTTPTAVNTSRRFIDLAVGLLHACALTAVGEAYCWGSNEYGQLGTTSGLAPCEGGIASCAQTPVPVATTLRFSRIATSLRDSCGLASQFETNTIGRLSSTRLLKSLPPCKKTHEHRR